MNRGTRRMWTRRLLRAGWLVAPVLDFLWKIPKGLWWFFFSNTDSIIWTCIGAVVVTGVTSCSVHATKMNTTATPAQITELIQKNPAYATCLKTFIPQLQVHFQRPINIRDLDTALNGCEESVSTAQAIAAQRAAVK